MEYETVIGLEVHAQLLTESKAFCSCTTRFGEEPNKNTCPICQGMPGVLPVLNRKALEFTVLMALACHCEINEVSRFARKNYYYPDLPKNYQISQYETPVAEHGWLEVETDDQTRRIGLTRIHMEEDAGKLIHDEHKPLSYVDFNRTGVPLIEIVSEPDIRFPEEAAAYLRALHAILVYLGICDGNMQEGSFRCDANVSIRPAGETRLGVKTELKNITLSETCRELCNMRSTGKPKWCEETARSCRIRACLIPRQASRFRCGAKNKPMTIVISRIRTFCH